MALRCLLVDDSPEFLASAARLLEAQGLTVVGSATSGAEARRLTSELAPDLALVDIELAGEDGIALADELAALAAPPSVVLVSAYERDDLAELINGSRAVGFLPKRLLGASTLAALLEPS